MPIGNLSSQHFANFLLHRLDAYIEELRFRYHGRYVDDFYIIGTDKAYMLECVGRIRSFLWDSLHVRLHKDKFYIQHYSKGVVFTGAIVKFGRVYPARRTVHNFMRAVQRLNGAKTPKQVEYCCASLNSYLGIMRHMDSYNVRKQGVMAFTEEAWQKVYVKGHYWSVHMRRSWKRVPLPEDEWLKVYYAKDV